MTDLKQIKELIEAGDKATQGDFFFIKKTDGYDLDNSDNGGYTIKVEESLLTLIDDSTYYNTAPPICDANFFTLAANSRPALKSLVDEVERLREALEHIVTCDRKPSTDIVRHLKSVAQQALPEGGA